MFLPPMFLPSPSAFIRGHSFSFLPPFALKKHSPPKVAAEAVRLTGMTGEAAALTTEAMLRNLTIAQRLGCLGAAGLAEMRRGRSPTITLGPYAGDQLSVDHIIPFAVAPQLDHVIANLELMPLRMNMGKKDKMGARQQALALQLRRAGLW